MNASQDDFQSKLNRLQEIIAKLEESDLPLEEGVTLFKEGTELAKNCRKQLHEAKHNVQIYAQGMLQDFEKFSENNDEQSPDEEDT